MVLSHLTGLLHCGQAIQLAMVDQSIHIRPLRLLWVDHEAAGSTVGPLTEIAAHRIFHSKVEPTNLLGARGAGELRAVSRL